MPYTPPLTPFINHVADPLDLPSRAPGDPGAARVVRATVLESGNGQVTMRAETSAGDHLFAAVTATDDSVVRVRLAPTAEVRTRSQPAIALVEERVARGASVTVDDGLVTVDAGGLVAEIRLDPWHLSFRDASGRVLVAQNGDASDVSYRLRVLPFGRSTTGDGQVIAYHETFTAEPDEHFFGLGEKFTAFDKRGQRVVSWNYDAFSSESERSYKNVPFYISSRGYGVLVNSGMATEFDLCHSIHTCAQIITPDDLLDYFVIAGPQVPDILRRYHRLTGAPQVPPKWALGTWMSNGFVRSDQERTLDVARRIRERNLPCDVLHIDAYWQRHGLWSHMEWDAEQFPDPKKLFTGLDELGFRTCLWMNPYVSVETEVFAEGDAKGYFLKRPDGSTYVADVWHGWQAACGITDFTNPAATAWFQELLQPLLDQGATLFKTDFGEGVPVDAVAANGLTGEALHNVYSLLFNDAVVDITERVAGHRVVWARSSFTGGQRHCGQWAGDTNATYPALASTLRGGLSYALSGVPYWSHDVGGFTGAPTADVFVRSAQFGAFSPLLRFHGNETRFPWDFPAEAEALVAEALRLRYRLMPYLYSAVVAAAETAVPVLRPLVAEGLDDPGAWSADLEYLWGPDMLVAPAINQEGQRTLYLPHGDWVDYWTGEVHAGGVHLRTRKPLGQIPLYVRRGALIPMVQPEDRVGDGPFDDLVLSYWGDADAHTVVRDEGPSTEVRVTRDAAGRVDVVTNGPAAVRGLVIPPIAGSPGTGAVFINGIRTERGPAGDWSGMAGATLFTVVRA
ncbi:TIM-barrel domain-containing protein [Actinosynnema sp. NPDC023794]